ncbi:NUDIX hydrolase [Leucobacter massiliensis]|uniref:NUDIX hydrolase n=1 Tax=Leucobacter massiliensis TaxID=1686285 RepID=UPI0015E30F4F|nr:hypothetical protein [Leucobacter massiliensis]
MSASERRTLPPAVAVSVVAFALKPPEDAILGAPEVPPGEIRLWIPLVRRTRAPFLGMWALPGGPTRWDETLSDTALRTLRAAVRRDPGTLEQLYSFGGVERSAQAQRLVTIAYWALYGEHELAAPPIRRSRTEGASSASPAAEPGTPSPRRWDDPEHPADPHPSGECPVTGPADAGEADPNVAWFSADSLPELAFDHREIVAYALARLRSQTEYASVAHRFLGPVFTLARLRTVTEAVLGAAVDPANFRRQVLAQGRLIDTGELETGAPHRPARLYRFREEPPDGARPEPPEPGAHARRPAAPGSRGAAPGEPRAPHGPAPSTRPRPVRTPPQTAQQTAPRSAP